MDELHLFQTEEEYEKHWKDMPEFNQRKKKEYSKIIFRFENEEDLQEFAKLIGQKLTNKTKSAWYPYKSHYQDVKKIWIDDNES